MKTEGDMVVIKLSNKHLVILLSLMTIVGVLWSSGYINPQKVFARGEQATISGAYQIATDENMAYVLDTRDGAVWLFNPLNKKVEPRYLGRAKFGFQ
jgi:hypothetical protein